MYSLTNMFHDLKCDFKRYCEFNELGDKPSLFEKTKVLLKSPGFFAIIVFRFYNDRKYK